MPWIPGDTLLNRYRIVTLLGQGATGAVYRAHDTRDDRAVALKEIRDTRPEARRKLREEVARLSRLNHPGLPALLDNFALDDQGLYIVYAYVDGVDLQTLVDKYGPLPGDRAARWLQEAADAVAYLHTQELLHLDLKPANLRLTPDDRIVVVDSGLAGLGFPVGTSGYAAPEQAGRRDVTPHSDIYALGATLYTLLTGQRPPDAQKVEVGLVDLKPARELNPDAEPYLSLVAQRAMSAKPALRYETVIDFGRALERPHGLPRRNAAPPPIHPRIAPSDMLRFVKARRRRAMLRRTMLALTALLVVLVIVAFGVGAISLGNRVEPVRGAEATSTFQSQVALALTQVAPTPTLPPTATPTPTPTPEPIVDSASGARMIYVPAGSFRMGNDETEDDERPAHLVQLDPYYIDETEVSNGQYAQCVDAGVCQPPRSRNASIHPGYYGDPLYDDYPVIYVDWQQAQSFCEWRGGSLPTEAQWEYAAGYNPNVAQMLLYPWGNAFEGQNSNFCDTNCVLDQRNAEIDDGHADTAPVDSYAGGRSPLGLYNMAGNVQEWVYDWYSQRYYAQASAINPLGPAEGVARALRGGSWISTSDGVRVARRASFVPEVARPYIGFRCARPPE